jgi:hypothetical protein
LSARESEGSERANDKAERSGDKYAEQRSLVAAWPDESRSDDTHGEADTTKQAGTAPTFPDARPTLAVVTKESEPPA